MFIIDKYTNYIRRYQNITTNANILAYYFSFVATTVIGIFILASSLHLSISLKQASHLAVVSPEEEQRWFAEQRKRRGGAGAEALLSIPAGGLEANVDVRAEHVQRRQLEHGRQRSKLQRQRAVAVEPVSAELQRTTARLN